MPYTMQPGYPAVGTLPVGDLGHFGLTTSPLVFGVFAATVAYMYWRMRKEGVKLLPQKKSLGCCGFGYAPFHPYAPRTHRLGKYRFGRG